MKTILSFFIICQISFANSMERCIVPDILIQTIKITENETLYPYYIRTNQSSTIETFYKIAKKYQYKKTEDNMLIDCINIDKCLKITNELLNNKITNLDLGLFQINYDSYKYPLYSYFNEDKSYINVCEIIKEKIKMNKGKWSWEVLASYHSMTPHLNKKYKEKLIKNYIKLSKKQGYTLSYNISRKEIKDTLVID